MSSTSRGMVTHNTRRATGEILPRTYGLMLQMPGNHNLFVTPMAFALAQIQLERPGEIRARIRDWVRRNGENVAETEERLKKGIGNEREREAFLNHSRQPKSDDRLALKGVRHLGAAFKGDVKSRSYGTDDPDKVDYHHVALHHPSANREIAIGFSYGECGCEDSRWNSYKKKSVTAECVHMAALEIALATDVASRAPSDKNITGLTPEARKIYLSRTSTLAHPSLPFTFNFFRSPSDCNALQLAQHRMLTDMFMTHFVKRKGHYELNCKALMHETLFSPALLKALAHPLDWAQFAVLRQDERTSAPESPAEDRLYGSITEALDKIDARFQKELGFVPVGNVRELVGTPWETVAIRYLEKRGHGGTGLVYSVCTREGIPPIIVCRNLEHKTGDLLDSKDPQPRVHPFARLGKPFFSRDDATRRMSLTRIILPTERGEGKGINVSAGLADVYRRLVAEYPAS